MDPEDPDLDSDPDPQHCSAQFFFLLFDRLLKRCVPILESVFLIGLIGNIEHFMGYQTAIRIFPVEP